MLQRSITTSVRAVSLLLFAAAAPVLADVTLLVGEPFGIFGAFNPTGHAALYLSRICAETPTQLRLCRPGEAGVVISRYNKVAGYDWIAVPLLPYLYAVDRVEDIPASGDARVALQLRDSYRQRHLRELAPDDPDGQIPQGDWIQLVGAAYDRNIHGIAVDTMIEDDERLIRYLNERRNDRRFNLFFRNCADFAREVINFYYPRALRRSLLADAGISTPKHSAKALVSYGRKHPQLRMSSFMIPQVAGGRRSTKLRGVGESLIRSKKYVVPLVVLQPWVAASAAAGYVISGRFDPSKAMQTVCDPAELDACMRPGWSHTRYNRCRGELTSAAQGNR